MTAPILRLCLLILIVRAAAGYCSLAIKVSDPAGKEVEARVIVQERDGRRVEQESQSGGARFCDLGITPVTITVGAPQCNQVIVRNVGLEWGKTANVSVICDRRPCLSDAPPVAACQFLLRFVDAGHKPVAGVSVRRQDPGDGTGTEKADEFGRLLVRIPANEALRAVGTAPGYGRSEVRIPCSSENQRVERYVVLRRSSSDVR